MTTMTYESLNSDANANAGNFNPQGTSEHVTMGLRHGGGDGLGRGPYIICGFDDGDVGDDLSMPLPAERTWRRRTHLC